MDFTLKRYRELLEELHAGGYQFCTSNLNANLNLNANANPNPNANPNLNANLNKGGDENSKEDGKVKVKVRVSVKVKVKTVFLRHDVDLRPERSLATAKIEAELGIRATYYFRAVPESWDEEIILEIARLGHAIGYHYESLTTCNGDVDKAYEDFCVNLERLRKLVSVNTICMHGSPRSPWDSKDIWKKYDYHKLGIDFEPYLDTDWSKVFYLTDTGRRWDGYKVSVRDKIPHWQDEWNRMGLSFHSTRDIIANVNLNPNPNLNVNLNPNLNPNANLNCFELPKKIMITTHPQRWTYNKKAWLMELFTQNIKNIVKRVLILFK